MAATVISAGSVGVAGVVRSTDPFRAIIGVGIPGSSQMLIADAVVEESHSDTCTITRHPVEGGSTTSDNVVDEPFEVTLLYGWSAGSPQNNGTATIGITDATADDEAVATPDALTRKIGANPHFLQAVYQQFLSLKASKIPFDIFTGKRAYTNMLIQSLSVTTDKDTENCLLIRVVCVQIITVQTTIFSLQTNPANTADPTTGTAVTPQGTQSTTPTPLPNTAAFQNSLSLSAAERFPFPVGGFQ
jgi:hypothetical protein